MKHMREEFVLTATLDLNSGLMRIFSVNSRAFPNLFLFLRLAR